MDNDYVIDNVQIGDRDRYVRYIWQPEHGVGDPLYVATGSNDEPPWMEASGEWGRGARDDYDEAFYEWVSRRMVYPEHSYVYTPTQIKYDGIAEIEVEEIDENNEDLDEFLKCFVLKEANS